MKRCIHCGVGLDNNASVCGSCDRPQAREEPSPEKRPAPEYPNPVMWAVGGLFFGALIGALIGGWQGAGIGAVFGLAMGFGGCLDGS